MDNSIQESFRQKLYQLRAYKLGEQSMGGDIPPGLVPPKGPVSPLNPSTMNAPPETTRDTCKTCDSSGNPNVPSSQLMSPSEIRRQSNEYKYPKASETVDDKFKRTQDELTQRRAEFEKNRQEFEKNSFHGDGMTDDERKAKVDKWKHDNNVKESLEYTIRRMKNRRY